MTNFYNTAASCSFLGYVEGPGEEFPMPGVIPCPAFADMALYPVWARKHPVDDVTYLWLSISDGKMFVCPVVRIDNGWDFDMEEAGWMDRDGNPLYDEYGYDRSPALADLWPEVARRCGGEGVPDVQQEAELRAIMA